LTFAYFNLHFILLNIIAFGTIVHMKTRLFKHYAK